MALDAAVSLEDRARIILKSSGKRGPNIDYLTNLARLLGEEGIHDEHIEDLLAVTLQMQRRRDAQAGRQPGTRSKI